MKTNNISKVSIEKNEAVGIIINDELILKVRFNGDSDSYGVVIEKQVQGKQLPIYDMKSEQRHIFISRKYEINLGEHIEKEHGRLSQERLQDLLLNALGGGSNYWYKMGGKSHAGINPVDSIFKKDGYITIIDDEGDNEPAKIDLEAVKKGEETMLRLYPHHYLDAIKEQDDVETADVFLQCIVFGDVIYS